MIFRDKDIKPEKSGCSICDDLLDIGLEPIPKELLENIPVPQRGNVISRTFGTFSIKEFEKVVGGIERCATSVKISKQIMTMKH